MQTNANVLNEIKSIIDDNVPQWYTIADCVSLSGLSDSTIRRALYSSELRGNKVGSRWLVKASWLEKYLSS